MADQNKYPVLKGDSLFRGNEPVYINRSDELKEYCDIIHKHDFIEIACVFSGTGTHIVADKRYETARGDLFVINFDVPHGFFKSDNSSSAPAVYNCVFKPGFLDVSLFSTSSFESIASSFLFKSLFPEDFATRPDITLRGTEFGEVILIFEKMYSEYKLMRKGYVDVIRACIIELIVKIFRIIEGSGQELHINKNYYLINKAIEYMKSNYRSGIKLTDLAMNSFLSKNYFSRIFKEITGTSVSDYIQYLRTDEACNLLASTDIKIADIAYQTGFSDIKFFYETFKKITGKTPGEYRKKYDYKISNSGKILSD